MYKLHAARIFDRYAPVFDPITAGALALTAAGTAVSAMGTIAGGQAQKQAGDAAADAATQAGEAAYRSGVDKQQQYEFEAKQTAQQGNEARASAQRLAFEKRHETDLLLSTVQARAAAGGGGALDPTVLNLAGSIEQRGEYGALLEMYKGENRARGLEDQATGLRMTGDAALAEGEGKRAQGYTEAAADRSVGAAKQRAANLSAVGTVIGGAGSAYRQYNKIDRYG